MEKNEIFSLLTIIFAGVALVFLIVNLASLSNVNTTQTVVMLYLILTMMAAIEWA